MGHGGAEYPLISLYGERRLDWRDERRVPAVKTRDVRAGNGVWTSVRRTIAMAGVLYARGIYGLALPANGTTGGKRVLYCLATELARVLRLMSPVTLTRTGASGREGSSDVSVGTDNTNASMTSH